MPYLAQCFAFNIVNKPQPALVVKPTRVHSEYMLENTFCGTLAPSFGTVWLGGLQPGHHYDHYGHHLCDDGDQLLVLTLGRLAASINVSLARHPS